MNNLPIETYESVVQQRDALEKKLADMAAENAAMKNAFGPGDAVFNFLTIALRHTTYDQIDLDDVSLAFRMSLPETPATNAFKKELMAKGVDALAVKYRNMIETMHPDTIAYGALKQEFESVIKEANKFAAQLRKGVNDAQ